MRSLIVALLLGLLAIPALAEEKRRDPPSPSEVQTAIADGRLIEGMSFKAAAQAMKPARAELTRAEGRIVAAIWVVKDGGSYAVRWSADVDPDMTIWNIHRKSVRQEDKNSAREQRIRAARERQRG